ncbi:MAG: acyl-CoA transferase [Alphaproteobacteria bacterium]
MNKNEAVMSILFEKLKELENIKVFKNEPLPQVIPENGIIFLHDGNLGEPEVLLSPPRYIYHHTAELEVIVQDIKAKNRDKLLDEILENIVQIFSRDTTLGGAVDYCLLGPPEFLLEASEGVIPLKAAIVPIILEYVSNKNI